MWTSCLSFSSYVGQRHHRRRHRRRLLYHRLLFEREFNSISLFDMGDVCEKSMHQQRKRAKRRKRT